ncbi:MAG: hypothetical protein M3444_04390 [Acidobacteriota bacterium]|nr:hypothetical protein [Acidobacteriota bacterium]MDQ5835454.1 hypothetical protein [Acidobacteriota bacterium]
MPDKKFGDEERQIWEFSNAGPVHYYIVREEPSSEMPLPPPQWALDLKAELGMPAGAVWRRHTTPGVVFGECWRDYTLQFFGMLISNEHEGPWPSWRVLDRAGKIVENVQIWYQRASHALSPVSCEVRWHPEKGETVTFPGLENAEKQKDITLAWRGKTLLQKVARRGRAFGTVTLTKDVFLSARYGLSNSGMTNVAKNLRTCSSRRNYL